MDRALAPYPWDAVPSVSRRSAVTARRTGRAVRALFDPDALSGALAAVLAADVAITVDDVTPGAPAPNPDRSVHVGTVDATVVLSIEPSAGFASVLLARILERPVKLVDGEAPLTTPMHGALAALAVEVARRARGTSELVALRSAPHGDGLGLRATVMLDDRPYGVLVWAAPGPAPTRDRARTETLGELGDTPISVPLLVAESTSTGREISDLSRGDIWMPEAGWFGGRDSSRLPDARSTLRWAALAAPSSERGVAVGHSEDGKIVLLGTAIALGRDPPDGEPSSDGSNMGGQNEDLNQVVLDSPVVVRVEVGTVTLTARDWAAVRAGDVLETGLNLAEPVVLRIAGREVARGELVSIDGELGVKIRELVGPGRAP
jgi:flagellar motor switch/type III secretory pathway protein FliN